MIQDIINEILSIKDLEKISSELLIFLGVARITLTWCDLNSFASGKEVSEICQVGIDLPMPPIKVAGRYASVQM